MNKKIIGIIQPFAIQQKFYVYEDGNRLEVMTPTIKEMKEIIFALSQKYDTTHVDLVGPKQYLRGFIKQIKKAEMEKYNCEKLEINII